MRKKIVAYIYCCIGWLFTGLAFAGAFLPVLPTVPFLLVAVWAFGKGSPRFRAWVFNHPWFKEPLEDWFHYGCIARRAKVTAIILMGVSGGFSIVYIPNIWIALMIVSILVASATFILTRPEKTDVTELTD